MTDEQLEKNLAAFRSLKAIIPDPRRSSVDEMMESQTGTWYLTSPASSRENFHSCFPGGLLDHSLRVVRYLKKLADAMCPGLFSDEALVFVALFHDLGKSGDGEHEGDVPNPTDWQRRNGEL